MVDLNKKPLAPGMRVKLSEQCPYTTTPANPKIGSRYEIEGIITSIVRNKQFSIIVKWDNDNINTYQPTDLIIVSARKNDNPNITFKYVKTKMI